jgi:hypothetical protein
MTTVDLTETLDAAVYVRRALESLPANPAATTVEDLRMLSAIGEGLAVRIEQVTGLARENACRVLDGRGDEVTADELLLPQLLGRRCELARGELDTYLRAALLARGFTTAGLTAGDNEKE